MAIPWELKLKLINAFCQVYFFTFAALTLIVGFNITLPAYSNGDPDTLYFLKMLAWFLFLNMGGNYFLIAYRARLSVVKAGYQTSNSFGSSSSPSEHTSQLQTPRTNIWNGYEHTGNNYNNNFGNGNYINENDVQEMTMNGFKPFHEGTETIGGWTYCGDCNIMVPPRAKHCPLCTHCVLKRDHHCFFGGCCVGFHNQRFFAIFLLYSGLGGIYNAVVTSSYVHQHFEALNTWGYVSYFLPVLLILWLFGNTPGSMVAMVIFLFWSYLTAIFCCYYFVVQVFLVCRGQTKYECTKGIRTYRGTVWKNIQSVFGRFWFVGFLVPAPFMGYTGDGTNWDDMLSEDKHL